MHRHGSRGLGGKVTVQEGGKVTCEITNTRDLAKLKLVKQVEGLNNADDWTLTAKASRRMTGWTSPPRVGRDSSRTSTPAVVHPGRDRPGWVLRQRLGVPAPTTRFRRPPQATGQLNNGDTITLEKGQKVTCTIVNTRDLGSLTIMKAFNPKTSGYDKAFDIDYTCGDDPKQTVQVKAGESEDDRRHPDRHRVHRLGGQTDRSAGRLVVLRADLRPGQWQGHGHREEPGRHGPGHQRDPETWDQHREDRLGDPGQPRGDRHLHLHGDQPR